MIDFDGECAELPLRRYDAGEVVIGEGGRTCALFFLVSGKVQISRGGIVLAELDEPGEIFGEISILLDRPHIVEVRAMVETEFRLAEDAAGFLRSHPELNLHLARALARRLDAVISYLADLKQQYGEDPGHLGMVHDVLGSLVHLRD